ncbi:MAG: ABC transporter transmembrane domain-containing protein [Candidatus Azotimanducaceae bacterium WSBS_2022_MAG_OTU7]
MIVFAYVNEKLTNAKMKEANNKANMNTNQMASNLRNVEVIEAMGMSNSIRARNQQQNDEVLLIQSEASRFAGKLSAISKSFRMIVQSMMIGLGAYLAIHQEISAGMVIAGSLLLGRALAPIDLLVSTWKGFSVARAELML